KIKDLQADLGASGADAIVLTLPETSCWLFNLRGTDVPNTPFSLGFAIVPRRGTPAYFVEPGKITPEAAAAAPFVRLEAMGTFEDALARLGDAAKTVVIDPANCPARIADLLTGAGAKLLEQPNPLIARKAAKTAAE